MNMIPITGLWTKQGRNGPFMAGKLGRATLLVFQNNRKRNNNDPDYQVFLAEGQGQGNRGQGNSNQGQYQGRGNQGRGQGRGQGNRYQPGQSGTYVGPIDGVEIKEGTTIRGSWIRYTLQTNDGKLAIFGDPNGQAGDWGEQARSYSGSGKHLEMAWLADEYGRKVTSFRILQACDNWGPGQYDPQPSQPSQPPQEPVQTQLDQPNPGQDQRGPDQSYGQSDCVAVPWDGETPPPQDDDDLPF